MARETITRRNLPHWYVPGAAHFVTFRLAGTLPHEVIKDLQQRKQRLLDQKPPPDLSPRQHRERAHKQLFAAYDKYLDEHRDISWLADPRVAAVVRSSLYNLRGWKFGLLAYCIMPNHVHVLFVPYDLDAPDEEWLLEPGERDDAASPLSSIMHSVKGFTAHEANTPLRRSGSFWQHESYDHWVRDEDELERIVDYINGNPVGAKLTPRAHEWSWGSAHDRYLTDGDLSGWLCLEKDSRPTLSGPRPHP